jgi:hypothetical protein
MEAAGAPDVRDPDEAIATTEKRRRTWSWPAGQRTSPSASVIERCSSKVEPQSLQRYS